jgi:hypothetical protein
MPAWAFYALTIALFSLGWGAARSLLGFGFVETLALLVIPFALVVWFRGGQSSPIAG